jgi:hypothetical protein
MKDNTIEIFVNEEYGYRTWIWRPNMTEEEFISWWDSLTESDIIKYYFNLKSLPGTLKPHKVKEVGTLGDGITRMYGDPKSHQPYYYCHMHDVDDTFMCIGKNRHSFRRTTRRDWKDYWLDWNLRMEKSSVA